MPIIFDSAAQEWRIETPNEEEKAALSQLAIDFLIKSFGATAAQLIIEKAAEYSRSQTGKVPYPKDMIISKQVGEA